MSLVLMVPKYYLLPVFSTLQLCTICNLLSLNIYLCAVTALYLCRNVKHTALVLYGTATKLVRP